MKKQAKVLLIATLCLLMALSFGMLAACTDDAQTAKTVTITVNLNMDGAANQTFTAEKGEDGKADFFGTLASYLPTDTHGLIFAGWRDSNGAEINVQTRWDGDGTAIAQWNAAYSIEYYVQTDEGFVKRDELTASKTGAVGSNVVADRIDIEGYVFDESNSLNVLSATLSAGTTLKLYYKRPILTVTFLANNPDAKGSMGQQEIPYGVTTTLMEIGFTWKNNDHSDFGGWNTQADGLGDGYANASEVTLSGNLTLYAQWSVTYSEQIWVEKLVDGEYVYELFKEKQITDRYLGNSISVQSVLTEDDYNTLGHSHYYLDETQNTPEAELGTTSLKDGDVLVAFYSLERFNVTYTDDNTVDSVRYGEQYTVRTPKEDLNSELVVVTYSTSPTGDGREYSFGKVVTVTENLTLYPVYAAVFTDAEGSGDKVVIRAGVSGIGSAKLIKDGVGYLGFIDDSSDVVTFKVTVRENDQDEGVTYNGKLYSDGTFLYRMENEVGVYLLGDPLFPDDGVSPYMMLALDGYGIGVLSTPAFDGSGRTENNYVNYALTTEGDYYMEYYLPSSPSNVNKGYFQIVHEQIEGAEELGLENVVGYFMLCGNEYGQHVYIEYGEYDLDCVLSLDGYGKGLLGYYIDNELQSGIEGTYIASANYTAKAPEYVFIPLDTANSSFEFILIAQKHPVTGATVSFFMIKQDEEGAYHPAADASYPELYLDGYGMSMYVDSERGDERIGTYTIKENNGTLEVTVSFTDKIGGTMRVSIDKENHVYQSLSNFEIVDNVLVKYYGTDSVIVVPEGVTEIDGNAFYDEATATHLKISTLTLPSTLTKIGDHAFENSSNSGRSALKTVYLNAVTPPQLGQDPFRWVTSEFKIIVPDDSLEAYRQDAAWTVKNGSAIYADYVTSQREIDDKPLYEVKNGVLLSYNNKEDNPQNVAIVIPDEVTEIAPRVFEGRLYIVSVNLNNVTVIGESAFDGCVNLDSVTFNPNTVSIGDYAFYNCFKLTELDLGNVQTIGDGSFALCYNLTKVNVGSRIASIGQQAFALCAVEVDENENVTKQNELVLTVSATAAPEMSANVFQGGIARIYVNDYETGVAFARSDTWQLYARHLRVKSSETQTLYSQANMGAELVLSDSALFDSSRMGLYKWEGTELHIAWFDYDGYTKRLTVLEQVGDLNESTGLIRGFSLYDNEPLVFVVAGTEITYSNGSEQLIVTFGSSEAVYNGSKVTIDIVNYRMQFNHNGYVYHVTLANDNTFAYTRNKIQTKTVYTSDDGSEITVTFGDSVTAIGTLKNVDTNLSITVEYTTWSLTEVGNGQYAWIVQWREKRYQVIATLDDTDNTFKYRVADYSDNVAYRSGDDHLVVTEFTDGTIDMLFSFKTANGELSCKVSDVQLVEGASSSYDVTIVIMIDVFNEDGEKVGEVPSEFNGNYRVTLDADNLTYTLTKLA